MIALILFDKNDDMLYVYSDTEFSSQMQNVADTMGIFVPEELADWRPSKTWKSGLDPTLLMQLFSPVLTSYRIMNHQFQNSYNSITCENGATIAFHKEMDYLLLAVAKTAIHATHLVQVCFEIIQHVCGPAFSL